MLPSIWVASSDGPGHVVLDERAALEHGDLGGVRADVDAHEVAPDRTAHGARGRCAGATVPRRPWSRPSSSPASSPLAAPGTHDRARARPHRARGRAGSPAPAPPVPPAGVPVGCLRSGVAPRPACGRRPSRRRPGAPARRGRLRRPASRPVPARLRSAGLGAGLCRPHRRGLARCRHRRHRRPASGARRGAGGAGAALDDVRGAAPSPAAARLTRLGAVASGRRSSRRGPRVLAGGPVRPPAAQPVGARRERSRPIRGRWSPRGRWMRVQTASRWALPSAARRSYRTWGRSLLVLLTRRAPRRRRHPGGPPVRGSQREPSRSIH